MTWHLNVGRNEWRRKRHGKELILPTLLTLKKGEEGPENINTQMSIFLCLSNDYVFVLRCCNRPC